jgi:hypothetical protein
MPEDRPGRLADVVSSQLPGRTAARPRPAMIDVDSGGPCRPKIHIDLVAMDATIRTFSQINDCACFLTSGTGPFNLADVTLSARVETGGSLKAGRAESR